MREEIKARQGSVQSCPQVIDEILVSQQDAEAAELMDVALNTFKDQSERPRDWYKKEVEKQTLADHLAGLRSEKQRAKKRRKK